MIGSAWEPWSSTSRTVGTATAFVLVLMAVVRMVAWAIGDYATWLGEVPAEAALLIVVLALVWLRPTVADDRPGRNESTQAERPGADAGGQHPRDAEYSPENLLASRGGPMILRFLASLVPAGAASLIDFLLPSRQLAAGAQAAWSIGSAGHRDCWRSVASCWPRAGAGSTAGPTPVRTSSAGEHCSYSSAASIGALAKARLSLGLDAAPPLGAGPRRGSCPDTSAERADPALPRRGRPGRSDPFLADPKSTLIRSRP
ncbi:MAG: hypothetical protein R3F21_09855 [Myxococcota bacterium]